MKADVVAHSSQARRERYGLAYGMFAAVIWGGYVGVIYRASTALEDCPYGGYSSCFGAFGLTYSPFYLATHGLFNLMQVDTSMLIQQALVLGILSGVVALFTFSRTVEYLGAARASLFPAFAPAIAIMIGIPLTKEFRRFGRWSAW